MRRELKIVPKVDSKTLRKEVNYLHKEVKLFIRRSEQRLIGKKVELAGSKGSKGFWKAIKELASEYRSKQNYS